MRMGDPLNSLNLLAFGGRGGDGGHGGRGFYFKISLFFSKFTSIFNYKVETEVMVEEEGMRLNIQVELMEDQVLNNIFY
jgi:hypothetical protein